MALAIRDAIRTRFLNWMQRIIRMRKEVPEIGWGDFAVLRIKNYDVLAMRYDWRGNSVVTVHNLNANPDA